MSADEQFTSDIDDREFLQLLAEIAQPGVSGAGLTDDEHQFQFNVKAASGEHIRIEPLPPLSRALKDGEHVQLVCGLPSGLVWVKARLQQEKVNEFSLTLSRAESEVRRLQRRASLRANVVQERGVTFKLTSLANSVAIAGTVLKLRDLSTGGFRADWPVGDVTPEVGQHISGFLAFPGGRPIELFGVIRSLQMNTAATHQIGVEFQALSLKDEQALLFVCLRTLG